MEDGGCWVGMVTCSLSTTLCLADWGTTITGCNQNIIIGSYTDKSDRRSAVWHTEWLISAGTRTRSLWIRSPARYSIAPQRLRQDKTCPARFTFVNPLISLLSASSQHQDQSEATCWLFRPRPLEGAVAPSEMSQVSRRVTGSRKLAFQKVRVTSS